MVSPYRVRQYGDAETDTFPWCVVDASNKTLDCYTHRSLADAVADDLNIGARQPAYRLCYVCAVHGTLVASTVMRGGREPLCDECNTKVVAMEQTPQHRMLQPPVSLRKAS